METSHHICIIFMLIIVAASESGLSPDLNPIAPPPLSPVAEPHRGPEGRCDFPGRWEGNWFQSGIHQTITINRNTINTKGRCLEASGEKYLVFNERENCFRCVVFHEKHYNLLQYKETFCVPDRRSIRNLCSTITGDANLFAMFRLDAVPIDCPFRAPMSVTYNRGHGECRYPVSAVESCIHPSRLLFNFQACPDVPGTESTAEEIVCLGSWKEGSYKYLVGLIQYRHHASYEERFRCFVYEKVKKGLGLLGQGGLYANNVRSSPLTFNSTSASSSSSTNPSDGNVMFRVAQSGDATCNGLTPYEGSRTMIFKRVQQTKPCYFPSWLQIHPRWHTLDQKTIFIFDSSTMKVVNGSGDSVGNDPKTLAVCSQILENRSDELTLVLHTTSAQCRNGYVCMKIFRRDTHVIELQMGTTSRQAEDACHPSSFNPNQVQYITLTVINSAKKRCPNLGHLGITSLAQAGRNTRDACAGEYHSLSVGCSRGDTMEFRMGCSDTKMISEYSCHGSWMEKGTNYLITTPSSSPNSKSTPRKYCFIYREMPIPLESKTYQEKLSKSKGYTEDGIAIFRRDELLEASLYRISIADSCHRDPEGTEGFLAFNVTSKGRCNDISGSSRLHTSHKILWLFAILAAFHLQMLQFQL